MALISKGRATPRAERKENHTWNRNCLLVVEHTHIPGCGPLGATQFRGILR